MLPQNLTPANTEQTFPCGGKTWKCEGSVISATCTGGKMTCSSDDPKEVGGGGGGSSKKSGSAAVRCSVLWIVAAVQAVKKFIS